MQKVVKEYFYQVYLSKPYSEGQEFLMQGGPYDSEEEARIEMKSAEDEYYNSDDYEVVGSKVFSSYQSDTHVFRVSDW